jgi:hypothetical protein
VIWKVTFDGVAQSGGSSLGLLSEDEGMIGILVPSVLCRCWRFRW